MSIMHIWFCCQSLRVPEWLFYINNRQPCGEKSITEEAEIQIYTPTVVSINRSETQLQDMLLFEYITTVSLSTYT